MPTNYWFSTWFSLIASMVTWIITRTHDIKYSSIFNISRLNAISWYQLSQTIHFLNCYMTMWSVKTGQTKIYKLLSIQASLASKAWLPRSHDTLGNKTLPCNEYEVIHCIKEKVKPVSHVAAVYSMHSPCICIGFYCKNFTFTPNLPCQ